jgi:hypothetical protein
MSRLASRFRTVRKLFLGISLANAAKIAPPFFIREMDFGNKYIDTVNDIIDSM